MVMMTVEITVMKNAVRECARARQPTTVRAPCPVCSRSMPVTRVGALRIHGPLSNRCKGSGMFRTSTSSAPAAPASSSQSASAVAAYSSSSSSSSSASSSASLSTPSLPPVFPSRPSYQCNTTFSYNKQYKKEDPY